VAKALQQLGLDRSQVDVEVVSEGRSGILGVGAQPARVIVTPRPGVMAQGARAQSDEDEYDEAEGGEEDYEDDGYKEEDEEDEEDSQPTVRTRTPVARAPADANDPVAVAVEILQTMLDKLDVDAAITPRPPETVGDGTVNAVLDIEGDDLGILIGRRGETLTALQYLVNLMLNRRISTRATVAIDVEGYRRRREESLRSLARRMADRVTSSGQSITLEPMPPNERRIVHIALADHPDVLTVSIGEGDARKVAITPRR
jgi:spoIIIJ-associated protein